MHCVVASGLVGWITSSCTGVPTKVTGYCISFHSCVYVMYIVIFLSQIWPQIELQRVSKILNIIKGL